MKELIMDMQMRDIFKLEIGDKTYYLNVRALGGWSQGPKNKTNYVELQAKDPDGNIHIVELFRVNELPKGWEKSYFTRIKAGQLTAA